MRTLTTQETKAVSGGALPTAPEAQYYYYYPANYYYYDPYYYPTYGYYTYDPYYSYGYYAYDALAAGFLLGALYY